MGISLEKSQFGTQISKDGSEFLDNYENPDSS